MTEDADSSERRWQFSGRWWRWTPLVVLVGWAVGAAVLLDGAANRESDSGDTVPASGDVDFEALGTGVGSLFLLFGLFVVTVLSIGLLIIWFYMAFRITPDARSAAQRRVVLVTAGATAGLGGLAIAWLWLLQLLIEVRGD